MYSFLQNFKSFFWLIFFDFSFLIDHQNKQQQKTEKAKTYLAPSVSFFSLLIVFTLLIQFHSAVIALNDRRKPWTDLH